LELKIENSKLEIENGLMGIKCFEGEKRRCQDSRPAPIAGFQF
jgi:hypothetical protein